MRYKRTITEVDLENTQNEAIIEAHAKMINRIEWAKMFGKAHFVVLLLSFIPAVMGKFEAWLYAIGYSFLLLLIANTIAGKAKANFIKTINREIDNGNADTL